MSNTALIIWFTLGGGLLLITAFIAALLYAMLKAESIQRQVEAELDEAPQLIEDYVEN